MLQLAPATLSMVRRFVGENHRHNLPPEGWLFGVAVHNNGELVGVGVASVPKARKLMQADPLLVEISRTCVLEGHPNANSMLYGALCRAAKALGYKRAITYTLQSESGSSVKAAGFRVDAMLEPSRGWAQPSRWRYETDLFGNERTPPGPKIRWKKDL